MKKLILHKSRSLINKEKRKSYFCYTYSVLSNVLHKFTLLVLQKRKAGKIRSIHCLWVWICVRATTTAVSLNDIHKSTVVLNAPLGTTGLLLALFLFLHLKNNFSSINLPSSNYLLSTCFKRLVKGTWYFTIRAI